MYTYLKSGKWVIIIIALLSSFNSWADFFDNDFWQSKFWQEDLQIHGFLSQGFFHTSDNNVYGPSDDSLSSGLTEIGLNFSYQPVEYFSIAAQGLFRRAGEVDSGSVRLDYGLADLALYQNSTSRIGIRGGRIKLPWGLYNETRDVAFTTPSIILPHGIYFDRSRSLLLSADGGAVYAQHSTDYGDFTFKFNYGLLLNDNKELQSAILTEAALGELKSEPSFMTQLAYEINGGEFIFAVSYADLELNYKPTSSDWLSDGNLHFRPVLFSAQYNGEKFSLTGEYSLQYNKFINFVENYSDIRLTAESWYIQAGYRIIPQVQAILRYDVRYTNIDDRNGDRQVARGLPNHIAFNKDWMFGLRWDINSHWMIRGEYHRINGTTWLTRADNPDLQQTKQHWDLFAFQFSFRF